MKAKTRGLFLITIIALTVIIITELCIFRWYISPGVKVMGKNGHVELGNNGYIINEASGEVLGSTTYVIMGTLNNLSTTDGTFAGYIQVESFPVPMKDILNSCLYATKDEELISIYYPGNRYASQDGILTPEYANKAYWVYVDTEYPLNTILHITSWDNATERYYVVPGESAEDALQNLNTFMQKQHGAGYPSIG